MNDILDLKNKYFTYIENTITDGNDWVDPYIIIDYYSNSRTEDWVIFMSHNTSLDQTFTKPYFDKYEALEDARYIIDHMTDNEITDAYDGRERNE